MTVLEPGFSKPRYFDQFGYTVTNIDKHMWCDQPLCSDQYIVTFDHTPCVLRVRFGLDQKSKNLSRRFLP